jgi:hypothetical protein
MLSSVLTLLFAPTFLLSIRYFDFKTVVCVYLFLSVIYFIVTLIRTKISKDLLTPLIYIVLLTLAYFYVDFRIVKYIPVFISALFFLLFLDASIGRKELIYKLTYRFYKKDLTAKESLFLKNSDIYWTLITGLNVMIQIALAHQSNAVLWAFYSSVGWYIFFFIALMVQLLYGKFHALRG